MGNLEMVPHGALKVRPMVNSRLIRKQFACELTVARPAKFNRTEKGCASANEGEPGPDTPCGSQDASRCGFNDRIPINTVMGETTTCAFYEPPVPSDSQGSAGPSSKASALVETDAFRAARPTYLCSAQALRTKKSTWSIYRTGAPLPR